MIFKDISSYFTDFFFKATFLFSNLRLSIFLKCSYFLANSEADVLIDMFFQKEKREAHTEKQRAKIQNMKYSKKASNGGRCVQNLALSNTNHEFGRSFLWVF